MPCKHIDLFAYGRGRIRTFEGISHQIYSLTNMCGFPKELRRFCHLRGAEWGACRTMGLVITFRMWAYVVAHISSLNSNRSIYKTSVLVMIYRRFICRLPTSPSS